MRACNFTVSLATAVLFAACSGSPKQPATPAPTGSASEAVAGSAAPEGLPVRRCTGRGVECSADVVRGGLLESLRDAYWIREEDVLGDPAGLGDGVVREGGSLDPRLCGGEAGRCLQRILGTGDGSEAHAGRGAVDSAGEKAGYGGNAGEAVWGRATTCCAGTVPA